MHIYIYVYIHIYYIHILYTTEKLKTEKQTAFPIKTF